MVAAGFVSCLLSLVAGATSLTIQVRDPAGRGVAGAAVMVYSTDHPARSHAPIHATMDQIHRRFVPDVLVIPVGSSVSFPNTDSTRHQVYSFSAPHPFQLPLYSGKPYPPELFEHTGIVTLGCNIHDGMVAYIVVTDAEWFGQTTAAGVWTAELPGGQYRIEIWTPRLHDRSKNVMAQVSLPDTGHLDLPVALDAPLRPAPLSGSTNSWTAY